MPPLGHDGRWFTDATGRVVMLRGMNFVEKWAPYTPGRRWLRRRRRRAAGGQRVQHDPAGRPVRVPDAEPGPGRSHYLESIAGTVGILARHGIYVLLDFHQDGFGPGDPRQRHARVGDV